MKVDMWKQHSFTMDSIPAWPCTKCQNGFLQLIGKEPAKKPSAETHFLSETYPESMNIEMDNGVFVTVFRCKNCHESYAVCGKYHGVHAVHPEHDEMDMDVYYYRPKYFTPNLRFFEIPKKCPKGVVAEIDNAFALYWSDLESCANKIRLSIEELLTIKGVKKTFVNSRGKTERYTLAKRIELYASIKSDLKNLFHAIRWVGNIGSHTSGQLSRDRVLDAFCILELILKKLYDNTEKEIEKTARVIIKRKGK